MMPSHCLLDAKQRCLQLVSVFLFAHHFFIKFACSPRVDFHHMYNNLQSGQVLRACCTPFCRPLDYFVCVGLNFTPHRSYFLQFFISFSSCAESFALQSVNFHPLRLFRLITSHCHFGY